MASAGPSPQRRAAPGRAPRNVTKSEAAELAARLPMASAVTLKQARDLSSSIILSDGRDLEWGPTPHAGSRAVAEAPRPVAVPTPRALKSELLSSHLHIDHDYGPTSPPPFQPRSPKGRRGGVGAGGGADVPAGAPSFFTRRARAPPVTVTIAGPHSSEALAADAYAVSSNLAASGLSTQRPTSAYAAERGRRHLATNFAYRDMDGDSPAPVTARTKSLKHLQTTYTSREPRPPPPMTSPRAMKNDLLKTHFSIV